MDIKNGISKQDSLTAKRTDRQLEAQKSTLGQKQASSSTEYIASKKGKLLDIDLETWLLDAGGLAIQKMAEQGESALSAPERAVHWMWLIDYSVRNAGCFGPLEDMGAKTALSDLARFAQDAKLSVLPSWLQLSDNEEAFCSTYYQHFDKACAELKGYYERTSA
ncbi:hypothetical protein [Herbaspirillum huttiense]|uniref:hypothetical protein n=1 Tax=Herbaspirillum huttiense TaxID=863372 RepID=UPI0039AF8659